MVTLNRTQQTDEELTAAVRAGDNDAFNNLLNRHAGLIGMAIRTFTLSSAVELDDLVQVGRLAMWAAAKKWGAGRGSKFATYAYTAIVNQMRKIIRQEMKQPIPLDPTTPSSDETGRFSLDSIPDLGRDEREQAELAATVERLLAPLGSLGATAVRAYVGMDGDPTRSQSQTANRLGMTRGQLRGVAMRGIRQARELVGAA